MEVDGFWIDEKPVTNRDFACFVRETGWITVVEQAPASADYPGALPEMPAPASLVFVRTAGPVPLNDLQAWWRYAPGARWRPFAGTGQQPRRALGPPGRPRGVG